MEHAPPADGETESAEVEDPPREKRDLEQELGIRLPPWQDDRLAPPIDEEKLRALWQRTIDAEESRLLLGNILRFRSWAEALCRIIVDEWRKRQPDDQA